MACIRMTSLRCAKSNGDWLARKRIPKDIRSGYEAMHGVREEARFRLAARHR